MSGRRFALVVRFTLGVMLASLMLFGTPRAAFAASIIYVKATAAGANNGTSWANAYTDLQAALAAAVSGQQIWVAKGTYLPTTGSDRTISFALKNGVAIYGGFAGTETLLSQRNVTANAATLSGDIGVAGDTSDNSYHVVLGNGTNSTAILDGFFIIDGHADGGHGGGMDNENSLSTGPTLGNLTFSANFADDGGGMYNNWSSPTLTNVTFETNITTGLGGGMMNMLSSNPTLTKVTFTGNQASGEGGGGMYNTAGSNPQLTDVTFTNNSALPATGSASASQGGGLYDFNNSNPVLTRVTFANNSATYGGGMFDGDNSPALTDVTFKDNTATVGGGGLYSGRNPTLTNVTFSGNSASASGTNSFGGGMAIDGGSPTLTNVTFTFNTTSGYGGGIWNSSSTAHLKNVTVSANTATQWGGGMYNDNSSNPTVEDSIFWGDNSTEVINTISTSGFTDSIVQGGCPFKSACTDVIDADPALGPLQNNGGFTETSALGAGSAAIDAGAFNSTCAPTDQRGVTRPQGPRCDIGAYEVQAMTFISQRPNDGWVLENGMNTNVGGSLNSTALFLRVGDDASNRRYRGFLSFDTSGLPTAPTIIQARLSLLKQTIVGDPFGTQVNLVTDLVRPYFSTSPLLQLSDFNAAATVSGAGTFSPVPNSDLYAADLNSAALGAINKSGTTQFRLRFSSEEYNGANDYISFFIIDLISLAHFPPTLVVYYNP